MKHFNCSLHSSVNKLISSEREVFYNKYFCGKVAKMTSSIFIKNGLENITNLLNNVESFCDLFDKPGTANLKSLLECPVCIGEQVFQCKNGHLLCTECLSKIKICPQCRDPMNQAARNLLAEQLVEETLPNCPFPEQGCTAKLDPSTTQQHQIDCTFRHWMPAGNK